jgi:hypothetical protein
MKSFLAWIGLAILLMFTTGCGGSSEPTVNDVMRLDSELKQAEARGDYLAAYKTARQLDKLTDHAIAEAEQQYGYNRFSTHSKQRKYSTMISSEQRIEVHGSDGPWAALALFAFTPVLLACGAVLTVLATAVGGLLGDGGAGFWIGLGLSGGILFALTAYVFFLLTPWSLLFTIPLAVITIGRVMDA